MRETRSRARSQRALLVSALLALAALAGSGATAIGQTVPFWQQPATPRGTPQPATPPQQAAPQPPPQQQAPPASPPIATVGDRVITQTDFDRIAVPYVERLRAQLGPGFTPELRRLAEFSVLDELVRREMLGIEARRRQLPITSADVDAVLAQDPFFQTNGKFDPSKLAAFKASPQSNYAQVLPRVREMAAMMKMDATLRRQFTPTPAQVREEYGKRFDVVKSRVFPLLTRDMPLDSEATESEWASYYQAHPEQFMRRTKLRLRLLRVPLPAETDSTRPAVQAAALARARAVADSLRARTLADTSSLLTDSGLFEVPTPAVPGVGRLTALTDTLARIDTDSTIRVVGPYAGPTSVVVGVVVERQAHHLPPMREVIADVKRRADSDRRLRTLDAERTAWFEANRDHWRGPRVHLTRVTFDVGSIVTQPPQPREVETWYAQHGHSLFGLPDTSRAWMPPLTDSLRKVASGRMREDLRPGRILQAVSGIAAAWRTSGDARALAKLPGVASDTLSLTRFSRPDSLFGQPLIDSLVARTAGAPGVIEGPRDFGRHWALWRVEAVDTAFAPALASVRTRVDQEFGDYRRKRDEDEARAQFDQHRADYRTPVRYALDYVAVAVPPADSVRITDAQVRHQYDANPALYRQEEEVKARHILLTTRSGDAEQDRRAKARADSLLDAIRTHGADFATLARQFTQDPSGAANGGDLGWFGHGRMVREFEQAAFALQPGGTSAVVRTQFGYHIIRVEDRHAAGMKPFDSVRKDIRLQLAQTYGDSLALRSAATLRRRLALGGNSPALTLRYGGVHTVAPIAATDPIPGLGFAQGLAQDLPTLVPGKWSPTSYHAGGSYLLVRVGSVVAPQPATFEEVRARASDDAKTAKRRALLERKVTAIRAALAAGGSLDSLAAPYGGLRDAEFTGQASPMVPMLGSEPRVVQKAFALQPGQTSDTLQVAQGIAWLRVDTHAAADPAAYKAAAAQIEAEAVKDKFEAWVATMRKSVRLVVLRPDLKGPRPNPFGSGAMGGN